MKGKCTNLDDNCPNFNKIIEVPDDQDFICPKCGHSLYEIEGGRKGSGGFKRLIIIVSAVVAVIVIAVLLWLCGRGDQTQSGQPASRNPGFIIDTLCKDNRENTGYFEPKSMGPSAIPPDTVVIRDTIKAVDTVRYEVNIIDKDIEFPFGYYVGETLNNKPNGKGTMFFIRSGTIPSRDKLKTYSAEPGYRVSGLWEDGYIMPGTGQVYDTGRKDENGKELFVYAL